MLTLDSSYLRVVTIKRLETMPKKLRPISRRTNMMHSVLVPVEVPASSGRVEAAGPAEAAQAVAVMSKASVIVVLGVYSLLLLSTEGYCNFSIFVQLYKVKVND